MSLAKGCFKRVFGADGMQPYAKPDVEAFRMVLQQIGADPLHTAMFEDSLKNLKTVRLVSAA